MTATRLQVLDPETLDQQVDDIRAAFRQVTGRYIPDIAAIVLIGNGWTTALLHAVTQIAEAALRNATLIALLTPHDLARHRDRAGITVADVAFRMLSDDVTRTDGIPAPALLDWFTLMAHAPDGDPDHVHDWPVREGFRDAVGEDLAPLVLAAGLHPEEARTRLTAGTLDPDVLRTLALLRGYPLLGHR